MSGTRTMDSIIIFAAALAISLACTTRSGAWARFPEAAPTQGEFDNDDPVGLAHGVFLTTDCEHHLSIGEKTYCFESDSSLLEFQKDPGLLLKAQAFWSQRHKP